MRAAGFPFNSLVNVVCGCCLFIAAFHNVLSSQNLRAENSLIDLAHHTVSPDFLTANGSLLLADFESANLDFGLSTDQVSYNATAEDFAISQVMSPLVYPIDSAALLTPPPSATGGYATEFAMLLGTRRYKNLLEQDDRQLKSGTQYGFRFALNVEPTNANHSYEVVTTGFFGDQSKNIDPHGYGIPDQEYSSHMLSGEFNYVMRQQHRAFYRRQLIGVRAVDLREQLDTTHYDSVFNVSPHGAPYQVFVDIMPFSQKLSHQMLGLQVGYEGGYRARRFDFSAGLRAAAGGDRGKLSTIRARDTIDLSANSSSPDPVPSTTAEFVTEVERDLGFRSLLEYQCSATYAVRPQTHATVGLYGISFAWYDNLNSGFDADNTLHYFGLQAGIQHRW